MSQHLKIQKSIYIFSLSVCVCVCVCVCELGVGGIISEFHVHCTCTLPQNLAVMGITLSSYPGSWGRGKESLYILRVTVIL